ncbi:hypothetical protein [Billgrantia sp. C5P2]|uniref:hypothetical protein n=1 Tax=Billgrantia sp. C5P2 TaxID=3436239 RepID=UPI003DA432CB
MSLRTMPPQDPELTEDEAWNEARTWFSRRLTRELLETAGIAPPSPPPAFKGYSLQHDPLKPDALQLMLERQRERA